MLYLILLLPLALAALSLIRNDRARTVILAAGQALLLALKEILGWLFVVSLVIAVISRFIPFHKTIRVRYAKAGDDMV